MGLPVALLQRGVPRLEVSNLFLTGFEFRQRLHVLLVRHQGSPEGLLLEGLLEPFRETVWLDVSEGCNELTHGTLGDHGLNVGVSIKQILDEQVFLEELDFGVR